MKRILIATGGSGGHVNPALSFFDHLKKNFDTSIVTDSRGLKFIDKKIYNVDLFDTPRMPKNPLFIISFFFFTYYIYI